ncbi:type IV secretory system conjugative DNA transfer family protein [Planosporangium thailandense]|uniref:Type IV secretory system conjugative DNA transfer family protein n=1 Tax=Planosporangium thailandense TaxID=765197 RepID=A0ABX0Y040_9ACTN|nr:TraM recognition domain-containing protein [Planosporangium thailandense]NJC70842.1 type IV secretory system conjugative DNA transfer family protein [Planosporangium thailandense]
MSSTDRRFPFRTAGCGLITTAVGWAWTDLAAGTPAEHYGPALLVGGAAMTAGTIYYRFRPARGSNALIGKWDRRSRRHGGTASRWDILATSSPLAMRRKAAVLRPSLRGATLLERWRTPVMSYATPLCTVGRLKVWTSCEESTLRVGIPGTGKSAEMACRVIDAPGAVVVTSTAADLVELTEPLRRARGPIHLFNPGGIGGRPSTLRWSPLAGCRDPQTAARRAIDLMGPVKAGTEGERWDIQGRRVLGVLMHAAALGGYRMRDVQAWVANPDAGRNAVLAALDRSPHAVAMRQAAEHAINTTPKTRDGVMLAIAPAVSWVTNPAAVEAGDAVGDGLFDMAEFLDRAGTLYLLGDDDGTVGPLVAALTAEIAYQARQIASRQPGGRLDPALTMVLDEIALVCPVPLDRWMAELRKRSITIHAACQGLGQLRQRWGDDGASMIVNSAAAVLVFGGAKDASDLAMFGQLAGERDEVTVVRDADGNVTSTSMRRAPVMSASHLASLKNHHALLIRRGMPVALARTPIAWKRRDVRRAAAADRKATRAAERVSVAEPRPAEADAEVPA